MVREQASRKLFFSHGSQWTPPPALPPFVLSPVDIYQEVDYIKNNNEQNNTKLRVWEQAF